MNLASFLLKQQKRCGVTCWSYLRDIGFPCDYCTWAFCSTALLFHTHHHDLSGRCFQQPFFTQVAFQRLAVDILFVEHGRLRRTLRCGSNTNCRNLLDVDLVSCC